MMLIIVFNHETIPFVLSQATERECLQAIEKAKESFYFSRQDAIVHEDFIYLHAWSKSENTTKKPKKRYYCYNDKVILQTDTKCEDEKESTRELLAYERNIEVDKICIIEV